MEAEEVVYLLEQHWKQLMAEMGDAWPDFETKYRNLVSPLPVDSDAVPEETVTAICELLDTHPAGRNLLKIDVSDKVVSRMAQTPDKVLMSAEPVQPSISNRLRVLPDRPVDGKSIKQQSVVTGPPATTNPHA
jgi:hypothetical protein